MCDEIITVKVQINENNNILYEQYIDSIINNYKNLGKNPTISIIHINKNNCNNIFIYLMYSCIMDKCYDNNQIKHIKNCICDNVNYEEFIINNKFEIFHIGERNSEYIDDICNILLELIKEFHLT